LARYSYAVKRVYGAIVVRLSVRPSVCNGRIVANRQGLRKTFTRVLNLNILQNFRHCKNIFKMRIKQKGEGNKMCVLMKNWPSRKRWEIAPCYH